MDIINIYDDNDNKIEMEVVSIFNIETNNYNYIIYRTTDKNHYYFGKYKEDNTNNLITDLNTEEISYAEKVF